MKPVIFLHVPKTAGTSIAKAFAKHCDLSMAGHLPYDEARKRFLRGRMQRGHHHGLVARRGPLSEEAWSAAFKFGFVRNPWDRALAFYLYKIAQHGGRKGRPSVPTPDGFAAWVRETPLFETARPATMLPEVDYVGRFEQLEDSIDDIERLLGIRLGRPIFHENRVRHGFDRDLGRWYDAETQEFVAELGAWEIEKCGYRFDDVA